jgi:hypothetical protein
MKSKLFALSIVSLFAIMGSAQAQPTLSTTAVLDLTGDVAQQLAIDIDSPTGTGSGCMAGNHECNSDLGELTKAIPDLVVAKIGVMSNNGYQIFMTSQNGGMKGAQAGINDSYTDPYSLSWETNAFPVAAGTRQPFLPVAVASGTFECSLDAGCPTGVTPTARHAVHLSKAAHPNLGYGHYTDKVTFLIEDANGT